ncbi:J domain-containing protein [Palleronia sp. KMU-117]|uniref:J domain-containing protein n=1 Tax=Palleronia sp. KMU-117 TaxID=3434108 RepID=UPI003D73D3DE
MTPIERTRAKSVALQTLGLGLYANPSEIRDAWRRIAFETHPDRNAEAQAEFARAKEAYDYLRNEIPGGYDANGGAWGRPRSAAQKVASRPAIMARITRLPETAIDECAGILAAETTPRQVIDLRGADRAAADPARATDHVPDAVHRHGRHLTFIVEAPTGQGLNRVALPTALLEDSRKVKPVIVCFEARLEGEGEVRLPDEVVASVFPGARGVEIRFSHR